MKILVAASPIVFNPFAELPFRSLRETFFQIVMLGVALCAFVRIMNSTGGGEGFLPRREKNTKTIFLLFVFSTAALWISLMVNGADAPAVKTVLNFMLGGLLFFAFMDSFGRSGVSGWVTILTAVVFINGAYAIAQFFGWDPIFNLLVKGDVYRPYLTAGFMDSPNMLAPLLVSVVPYFFARWMTAAGARDFFIYSAALLFLLVPIAFTRNVAGWLSLALLLFALLVFFSWYEQCHTAGRVKRIIFCWLCVILLAGGGAASYLKAAGPVKPDKIQSIRERVTQNRAAWMMFAESPLVGKGPNYFYRHFVEYRRAVWFSNPPERIPERAAHQAHNDYIQLLAEGGLLAGLPVAGILVLLLSEQLGFFRRILSERILMRGDLLTIGAAGGFWAIAINGVGNFPFHVAPLAVAALFWAALSHHLIMEKAN